MNAFRVTIIVLLAAVVGLMFYVLAVYLPDQREQYSVYQAMKNKESWDRRQEAHDRRLRQYGPGAESAEEEQARKAAEQHSAELDKKLNEAEERSVLEEAQRREDAARAAADAAAAKESSPQPLGVVASMDSEWNIILCSPAGPCPENGTVVAVIRDGRLVCEATVDGQDTESGQFTATLRPIAVPEGDTSIDPSKFTPKAGDAVIVSPLINIDDAMESYVNPHANPSPSAPSGNSAPEEIEGTLIPVP